MMWAIDAVIIIFTGASAFLIGFVQGQKVGVTKGIIYGVKNAKQLKWRMK